jgi:hypothetical protein
MHLGVTVAKHLTDRDIEAVVKILDGWQGKLSWELLCEACVSRIGIKPSRQTLWKVVRIQDAFEQCKKRIKEGEPKVTLPLSLKIAADTIARLERENQRLERENTRLLEQFVVWQYNAYAAGRTKFDLSRPLPKREMGNTD